MPRQFREFAMHSDALATAVGIAIGPLLTAAHASAQLDWIFKGLGVGQQTELSEARVASGLKEALQLGTENAVGVAGRLDGYFRNQAIKILMPEKLRTLDKGLRLVGYSHRLTSSDGPNGA